MAYFSNATEAEMFSARQCFICQHWRVGEDGEDEGCPIYDIHFAYNYDQCRKTEAGKVIKEILEMLIPTEKDSLFAGQCSMFEASGECIGQSKMDFQKAR